MLETKSSMRQLKNKSVTEAVSQLTRTTNMIASLVVNQRVSRVPKPLSPPTVPSMEGASRSNPKVTRLATA